jgi:DNA-binding LytR/AlgR family response regulator
MDSVLIIDDDLMEQIRLRAMVGEFGYAKIQSVSSLKQARTALQKTSPSLLIADIYLHNETALELLADIQQQAIPTIFITASTDESLYQQLKESPQTYGYLVKPFDKLTLFSTIRLVTANQAPPQNPDKGFLMVRTQKGQKKIALDEILWLEASGNYSLVVTASEKFAVKQSLLRLAETLGDSFLRVHKRFCVNISKITHLNAHSVVVNNQEILVSYTRKRALMEKLNGQNRILDSDAHLTPF